MKGKILYSFAWIGGGYNQVYANNKSEIPQAIKEQIGNVKLKIDMGSVKAHTTREQMDAYWKSIPYLD